MCVHQNTSVAIAPSTQVDEIIVRISGIDDDDTEPETDTRSSIKTPLFPGKTLPLPASSTGSKSKKSAGEKKSVRFNQSVNARPSLHKNNYTSHETAAAWYSRKEYDSIRKDLLGTLSLIHTGDFVEDESDSFEFRTRTNQPLHNSSSRGLENYTAKGSLKSDIKKLREKAVLAVLVEQDFQVEQAESYKMTYLYYDAKQIEDVYRKHSKIAADAARNRAIFDAKVASGAMTDNIAYASGQNNRSRRQSLRRIFKKSSIEQSHASSENKVQSKQQRRWSKTSEKSDASSKKKVQTKQKRLWSLLGSSSKVSTSSLKGPNSPTALVA